MSDFDDASLVLIPSGYKNGKVYSVKPTDGTGDLTFSRASSATRVQSDGLIEKVRTNLLLYSQDPSNAVWTKTNTTYSGDTLTAVGGLNSKYLFQAQAQQGLQTIYFDLAYVSHQFFQVFHVSGAGDVQFANFDILNKVVATSGGGAINATLQDFGTFVRIALVLSTTTKTTCALAFVDSGSATRGASSTSTGSVKVFRAQNETGDIATDYIPTTTAAVSVGPVSGLPRLDYLNSTCPKLLLEPQRSNLVTFSEQFNNAAWTKLNATVTANAAASPDGYVNADKLIANSGAVLSSISNYALQAITKAASAIQYTYSVFAKQSGLNRISIFAQGTSAANHAIVTISLVNGTISTAAASAGTFTGASASVSDYGNGWYRCALVFTTNTDTALTVRNIPTDSTLTTGNGTDGILIYGAQLEQASYATSYIPTLGASVTRVADAATKTGISSLIGQTEGTIFAEVDFDAAVNTEGYIFRIDVSSFNDTVYVSRGGDKILTGGLRAGGSNVVQLQKTAFNGVNKLAFAYKSGSFALYVNGTQVATSAATYTNGITYDDIRIGGFSATTSNMSGGISQMLLFKTRLTNAQLAELTA